MRTEGFEPPTCWSGVRHATVAPCPLVIILNNDISFQTNKFFVSKNQYYYLIYVLSDKINYSIYIKN